MSAALGLPGPTISVHRGVKRRRLSWLTGSCTRRALGASCMPSTRLPARRCGNSIHKRIRVPHGTHAATSLIEVLRYGRARSLSPQWMAFSTHSMPKPENSCGAHPPSRITRCPIRARARSILPGTSPSSATAARTWIMGRSAATCPHMTSIRARSNGGFTPCQVLRERPLKIPSLQPPKRPGPPFATQCTKGVGPFGTASHTTQHSISCISGRQMPRHMTCVSSDQARATHCSLQRSSQSMRIPVAWLGIFRRPPVTTGISIQCRS